MKKLNLILLGLNLFLLIGYNFAIQLGLVQRVDYDFGANMVVLTCVTISAYILRHASSIRWLGSQVETGHTSGIILSKAFSLICLIPACFMNMHPILRWITG